MTGIVLCGGASSRMGTDKCLLPATEGNWAKAALMKLQAVGLPTALSIRPGQQQHFGSVFPNVDLIPDRTGLPVKGPLLALLSCHEARPFEDLVVLACDMPLIQPSQLQRLLARHREQSGFEAYAYLLHDRFEPLCAIYTSKGLESLSWLARAPMATFSLQYALRHLRTWSIPVLAEETACFQNFNMPADLASLNQIPPSP